MGNATGGSPGDSVPSADATTREPISGEGEGSYGLSADIWSLGILVAEMCNRGQLPWPDFPSPMHAMLYIGNGGAPRLPANLSASCTAFISSCLQPDPTARPTAAELKLADWLCEEA